MQLTKNPFTFVNRVKFRPTHIDTLSELTPKGRRRVRRTLGMVTGVRVSASQAVEARMKARDRQHTARKAKS